MLQQQQDWNCHAKGQGEMTLRIWKNQAKKSVVVQAGSRVCTEIKTRAKIDA